MKENGPKDRILATAARLFYEQGYTQTGINQILEEAKVAKASLYQHYGSKDELGVAYLKHEREKWFPMFYKYLDHYSAPLDKILACFDFLEESQSKRDFKGCRFINLLSEVSDSSPKMREQIVEHKSKLRTLFTHLVMSYQPNSPQSLADSIYLLFEGAIVEGKIYKHSWPFRTAKNTTRKMLEQ
ncbi:TetR/AcrR family transcriptional regulator [Runella sp.]|uniref:TetR/AcrR family transcriptional regulator n=1 Tax=Runella sp. TaxID=1960881 RepID=UPI003D14BB68